MKEDLVDDGRLSIVFTRGYCNRDWASSLDGSSNDRDERKRETHESIAEWILEIKN
jgi:hypothetical protein